LGQPDRAEGDGVELGRLLADGGGELRRPAADVDAQRARRLWLAVKDAEADEARLLLAGDDLEVQPGLVAGAADDLVLVLRLAARAGGDGAAVGAVAAAERSEPPQRREQPIGDVARDGAAPEHPLAGPDRVALLVHDLQRAVPF